MTAPAGGREREVGPGPELPRTGAARAYKDVIGELDAAATALRDADRERAVQLAKELVVRQDAMARAVERAELSRAVLLLHWEAVLEALWTESWLTLRPLPDPLPSAGDLDALDDAVARTATALIEAARRRRFGLPGR